MLARSCTPLLPALLAGALLLPQAAVAQAPRDPSGVWLTEDTRARIRLEKCGPGNERLCGYVVWMKSPTSDEGQARLDVKNPDPKKRSRPVLGHQLMLGLSPNEEGGFGGKIYNNEDGKSYDVTVWLDKPATLKVKGCLIAFLCSTQIWTRTTDPLPGQRAAATGSPGGPQPDPEWASGRPTATPASASAAPKRDAKPRP